MASMLNQLRCLTELKRGILNATRQMPEKPSRMPLSQVVIGAGLYLKLFPVDLDVEGELNSG
jgi:hypothetical protein